MGSALHHWRFALAAIWFAMAADAVWAQGAAAGRFLTAVGDVRVMGHDGAQRAAQRGTQIYEGETLLTGANGFAQLRLADGAQLSLRANTEMKLEKFAYAGAGDKNASLFIVLLKGGFRSVTGLIGRLNRDGYRITTVSATIGIRGTDHEVVHVTPPAATPQVAAGTYDRVYEGQTVIQNKQGVMQVVNRGEVGFVSLAGAAPVLVAPPPSLFAQSPVRQGAPKSAPEAAPGTSESGSPTTVSPTPTSPAQQATPPGQSAPPKSAPAGEKPPTAGPGQKSAPAAPPGAAKKP